MIELLATLGNLVAALGNASSAAALKEHLALLNTKLQLLHEHVVKLEKENADLVRRNAELAEQLCRQKAREDFEQARGALFKRRTGDGYSPSCYCPVCLRPMSCAHDSFLYKCSNAACLHKADFTGAELGDVLASLPA